MNVIFIYFINFHFIQFDLLFNKNIPITGTKFNIKINTSNQFFKNRT